MILADLLPPLPATRRTRSRRVGVTKYIEIATADTEEFIPSLTRLPSDLRQLRQCKRVRAIIWIPKVALKKWNFNRCNEEVHPDEECHPPKADSEDDSLDSDIVDK